jgi:hypothetical protein
MNYELFCRLGICDCCDGSDEEATQSSARTHCPNTCHEIISKLRSDALEEYRVIQSGIRRKQEILRNYESSVHQRKKQLTELQGQRKELSDMLFTMRYLYEKKEAPLESYLRLQLIRERQMNCAMTLGSDLTMMIDHHHHHHHEAPATATSGDMKLHIGNCDYFYAGYIHEQEMVDYVHTIRYANRPSHMKYRHTEAEIQHMNSLSGIQRIRGTLCQAEDLLPDDNPNIFVTLGDYLQHATSNSTSKLLYNGNELASTKLGPLLVGKVYFDSLHQKYFGRYMLAPYLDEGSRGYLLGAIIVIEVFTIPLLPFIFTLYGLDYIKDSLIHELWNNILSVGTIDDPHSSSPSLNESPEEESILQYIANIIIEIFDDDHENNPIAGFEGATSLLFDEHDHTKSSEEHEHDHYAWIDDLLFNNPLSSAINTVFDQVIYPLLYIPRWIMTIAYTSPWMYIQYYFYGKFELIVRVSI